MDWIAEQLFTLFNDIQTGNLENNDQVPAIIAAIFAFGCFMARGHIWNLLKKIVQNTQDFFQVKKLESEIKEEQNKIKSILKRVEQKVYQLDRNRLIFHDERDKVLNSINNIRYDVREEVVAQVIPPLQALEENYRDSVEITRAIEQLLEDILDTNRAEQIRQNYKQMAEDIMREVEADNKDHLDI